MKKLILPIGIGIAALVALAGLAVHFFLDSAIKKGVETLGPKVAQVEVKLDSASLSILSGSGKIRGLMVGNPEGFRTRSAVHIGSASLAVQIGSIFSPKVVVRSVHVQQPEITLEASFHGSNLSKILKNLKSSSGAEGKPVTGDGKPGKKLEVDEVVIAGGKVRVSFVGLAGKTADVPLPEIRLKDLGTGPEGITTAELADKVLSAMLDKSIEVSAGAVADLGRQAAEVAAKATKGIGGVFRRGK